MARHPLPAGAAVGPGAGDPALKILLTGRPGVGKTTVIRRLAGALADLEPTGFCTEEIREGGRRVGFRLSGFHGETGVLARVGRGPPRVGRYGVDVEGLEAFLARVPWDRGRVILLDEIGRMECLSGRFVSLVERLLEDPRPVVATRALKVPPAVAPLLEAVPHRVLRVTERNRDALPAGLARTVREAAAGLPGPDR